MKTQLLYVIRPVYVGIKVYIYYIYIYISGYNLYVLLTAELTGNCCRERSEKLATIDKVDKRQIDNRQIDSRQSTNR